MTDLATQDWLDQKDRHVAETIRRHGCYIQYVTGCTCGDCDEPTPFAYTIGLFGLGHPELLVFGTDPHTAAGLLNALFARVGAGSDLTPGEIVTFPDWPHRVLVEECPNPGEIAFSANRHYRRPDAASVPVLQLTWDDRHGRFPWEAGYSVPAGVQPRPGAFRA